MKITRGKFDGINAIANQQGVIAALAIDQRSSLKKILVKATNREVSNDEVRQFKNQVTQTLTPYASAVLLDVEYGLEALNHRAPNCGALLAYDKSGYDPNLKGRIPDVLPRWSVLRLVALGTNAVKIIIYYNPDDDESINQTKYAFVERIGAECQAADVSFFLEVVSYSSEIEDEKSLAFALIKPAIVKAAMLEFSRPQYAVDVLKVEAPVNMRYVEGSKANLDGQVAYSREEAKAYFLETSQAAAVPFIYLSAGVSEEVFRETLELAAEAGASFAGVLCGRSTWQGGVAAYAQSGDAALKTWLQEQGVRNIEALNTVLNRCATPWWNVYGGKTAIEVIDK